MMFLALQPDPNQGFGDPAYGQTSYAPPTLWHQITVALEQSVGRVLSLLISILPALLAFLLALALLTALGIFFSWAIRKILNAAHFDDRMNRNETSGTLPDWTGTRSPTALVGRVVFWSCVLAGLMIGLSAFDTAFQSGSNVFTVSVLPYLTHAVGAILLLFAGNLVARYLARTVLIGAVNSNLQYARFLSLGVKWLVLVLTAAMVLDHLQIGGAIVELAFGILFGGIVLTLALAIGLGSRELVSRSLERGTDARPERAAAEAVHDSLRTEADPLPYVSRPPVAAGETLRHF